MFSFYTRWPFFNFNQTSCFCGSVSWIASNGTCIIPCSCRKSQHKDYSAKRVFGFIKPILLEFPLTASTHFLINALFLFAGQLLPLYSYFNDTHPKIVSALELLISWLSVVWIVFFSVSLCCIRNAKSTTCSFILISIHFVPSFYFLTITVSWEI